MPPILEAIRQISRDIYLAIAATLSIIRRAIGAFLLQVWEAAKMLVRVIAVTGINFLGYVFDKILFGAQSLRKNTAGPLPNTTPTSFSRFTNARRVFGIDFFAWNPTNPVYRNLDNILSLLGGGFGVVGYLNLLMESFIRAARRSFNLLDYLGMSTLWDKKKRGPKPDDCHPALRAFFIGLTSPVWVPCILVTNLMDATAGLIRHTALSIAYIVQNHWHALGKEGVWGEQETKEDTRHWFLRWGFPFFITNIIIAFPIVAISNAADFVLTSAWYIGESTRRNFVYFSHRSLGENGVFGAAIAKEDDAKTEEKRRLYLLKLFSIGVSALLIWGPAVVLTNTIDLAASYLKHTALSIGYIVRNHWHALGKEGVWGEQKTEADTRHWFLRWGFPFFVTNIIIAFPIVAISNAADFVLTSAWYIGESTRRNFVYFSHRILGENGVFGAAIAKEDDARTEEKRRLYFLKLFSIGVSAALIWGPAVALTNTIDLAASYLKHTALSIAFIVQNHWHALGKEGVWGEQETKEDTRHWLLRWGPPFFITNSIIAFPIVAISNAADFVLTTAWYVGESTRRNFLYFSHRVLGRHGVLERNAIFAPVIDKDQQVEKLGEDKRRLYFLKILSIGLSAILWVPAIIITNSADILFSGAYSLVMNYSESIKRNYDSFHSVLSYFDRWSIPFKSRVTVAVARRPSTWQAAPNPVYSRAAYRNEMSAANPAASPLRAAASATKIQTPDLRTPTAPPVGPRVDITPEDDALVLAIGAVASHQAEDHSGVKAATARRTVLIAEDDTADPAAVAVAIKDGDHSDLRAATAPPASEAMVDTDPQSRTELAPLSFWEESRLTQAKWLLLGLASSPFWLPTILATNIFDLSVSLLSHGAYNWAYSIYAIVGSHYNSFLTYTGMGPGILRHPVPVNDERPAFRFAAHLASMFIWLPVIVLTNLFDVALSASWFLTEHMGLTVMEIVQSFYNIAWQNPRLFPKRTEYKALHSWPWRVVTAPIWAPVLLVTNLSFFSVGLTVATGRNLVASNLTIFKNAYRLPKGRDTVLFSFFQVPQETPEVDSAAAPAVAASLNADPEALPVPPLRERAKRWAIFIACAIATLWLWLPTVLVVNLLDLVLVGSKKFGYHFAESFRRNIRISYNLLGSYGLYEKRLNYERDDRSELTKWTFGIVTAPILLPLVVASNSLDFGVSGFLYIGGSFVGSVVEIFTKHYYSGLSLAGLSLLVGPRETTAAAALPTPSAPLANPLHSGLGAKAAATTAARIVAPSAPSAELGDKAEDVVVAVSAQADSDEPAIEDAPTNPTTDAPTAASAEVLSPWTKLVFGADRLCRGVIIRGLAIAVCSPVLLLTNAFDISYTFIGHSLISVGIHVANYWDWPLAHRSVISPRKKDEYAVDTRQWALTRIFFGAVSFVPVLIICSVSSTAHLVVNFAYHSALSFAATLVNYWDWPLGQYSVFSNRQPSEEAFKFSESKRHHQAVGALGALMGFVVCGFTSTINLALTGVAYTGASILMNLLLQINWLGRNAVIPGHYSWDDLKAYDLRRHEMARKVFSVITAIVWGPLVLAINALHLVLLFPIKTLVEDFLFCSNYFWRGEGVFGGGYQYSEQRPSKLLLYITRVFTAIPVLTLALITNLIDTFLAKRFWTETVPVTLLVISSPAWWTGGLLLRKFFVGIYKLFAIPMDNRSYKLARWFRSLANVATFGIIALPKFLFKLVSALHFNGWSLSIGRGYSGRFGFASGPVPGSIQNVDDARAFFREEIALAKSGWNNASVVQVGPPVAVNPVMASPASTGLVAESSIASEAGVPAPIAVPANVKASQLNPAQFFMRPLGFRSPEEYALKTAHDALESNATNMQGFFSAYKVALTELRDKCTEVPNKEVIDRVSAYLDVKFKVSSKTAS